MKKYTINQWCDIFGIQIIDLDGPLRLTDKNQEIEIEDFVSGVAECTINPVNRDKWSVLEKLF